MKFKSLIIKTSLIGGKKILSKFNDEDIPVLDKLLRKVNVIASNAFSGSEIEKIVIPSHIKLEDQSFSNCQDLKQVLIFNGNELYHHAIFAECCSLSKVQISGNCEIIGESCFRNTAIKEIFIPDGLKEISSNAFSNSALETIYLPSSTKFVGKSAFKFCPLEKISVPETCILQDRTAQRAIFKQNLIANPNSVPQPIIKKMLDGHRLFCQDVKSGRKHIDAPLPTLVEEDNFIHFLEGFVQD